METWSSASRGKGLASADSISAPPDVIAMEKNGMVGWELKYPCGFENNLLHSSQEAIESLGCVGLGTLDMIVEPSPNDSDRDVLSQKFGGGRMVNSVVATTKTVSEEQNSCSKLSSSVAESSCKDSSFVDLKLGRFADQKDAQNYNFSKALTNLSSIQSSRPAKRVRPGNLGSNTPFCQVHGCKKDLSLSKDYHKRHKVCEIHSKTAKVIVNGNEQRFCQQCSRFHLLDEFDNGKRSCRKRLAGHNERRRKPPGGNGFQGNAFASSFVCQDTPWSSLLQPQKYGTNDWCRNVKLEDVSDYCQESAISITNGHLHPRSLFYSHGFENQYPYQENRVSTPCGSKCSENSCLFPHLAGSKFFSHLFYQNPSTGCDALAILDSVSTAQGLSRISDSDCALSLLSPQSENYSRSSVTHCLLMAGSNAPYSVTETSGKVLAVTSLASGSGISSKLYSSVMNSSNGSHLDTALFSDDAVNFELYENFQGSECMKAKNPLQCDDMPTIDLLQLSSKLQQVECQKKSVLLKKENDASCGL